MAWRLGEWGMDRLAARVSDPGKSHPSLASQVRYKAESPAFRAKAEGDRNIVIKGGLVLSGMVGWSCNLPALLGLALGMWIDRRVPQLLFNGH